MDKAVEQFLSRLQAEPHAFGFYRAMRRLHALDRTMNLGKSVHPREDRIRLHQQPDLRFQGSTVRDFTPPDDEKPGKMSVTSGPST